jgi:hypothetical protein
MAQAAQEYVTTYGKVILERDVLYLRSMYLPYSKSGFARISFALIWVVAFLIQFAFPGGLEKYVRIIFWSILLLLRMPDIYDILFRRSYAARIPLNRIASFSVHEDHFGYRTIVRLDLKNGRYRKIIFRKLEHQAESFTEKIAASIHHPQLA